MSLTFKELQAGIERAKKAGACSTELNKLKQLTTIEQFLNHPEAPGWVYWYAAEVLKQRCVEGEKIILTSPDYCYFYAINIVQGRWPEAEEVLAKDMQYLCSYVYHFHEAIPHVEDYFLKSPQGACIFAVETLGGRWLRGEETIKKAQSMLACMLSMHSDIRGQKQNQ